MFSIFNKNKTNSRVITKTPTLTNDQPLEEDNNDDPIIPSINKINVVEHNCNDLGNIEIGPMRPILTLSGLTICAYYDLFLKYLRIDLLL